MDGVQNNTCFVIAPIGKAGSDTRQRSDTVLQYMLKPAATECGLQARRSDEIDESGIITNQIIHHLVEDPMVIADLTERNPNVYYELAVRHATGKPFVQIIEQGEPIPFDIASVRTIEIDSQTIAGGDKARQDIARQVRANKESSAIIHNPILAAVTLERLWQAASPEKRQLGDVLEAIAEVRTAVGLLEGRLGDPTSLLPPEYLREAIEGTSDRVASATLYGMKTLEALQQLEGDLLEVAGMLRREDLESDRIRHRVEAVQLRLVQMRADSGILLAVLTKPRRSR